jgi:predicted phosphodiesterase
MKKNLFLLIFVFIGITTLHTATAQTYDPYAQAPYNIVMNIPQDPSSQMAFNWLTDVGVTGGKIEILLGTDVIKTVPATCTQYSKYTTNKTLVTGLSPHTTYSFRVGGVNNNWSSIGTFTTAKNNKDSFSFIYTTDPHTSDLPQSTFAAITFHAAFAKYPNANFLMLCGDFVDDGNLQSQWNQFFSTQQDIFYKYTFAPVIGNHDTLHDNHNFKRFFNLGTPAIDNTYGSTYTFIYGDAQFFALNSERYSDTAYIAKLKKWMQDSINAHPNIQWRIVFFHKSIYTGGKHQSELSSREWRDAMAPLFDKLNIDLALQGHNHIYEVIGPVKNKKIVQEETHYVQDVTPVYPQNISGKSGGIFDVKEGTLYFLNGYSGAKKYYPTPFASMPDSSITGVSNYLSLFTGRFGQNGNPTYSHVSVSTDCIIITTYEVLPNGADALLDEIKMAKNICDSSHHEFLDKISIYPNPTTGELRMENGEWRITNVEIYDIYGKNVSNLISHISNQKINISYLNSGIYFVMIDTEQGRIIKKIVKQ